MYSVFEIKLTVSVLVIIDLAICSKASVTFLPVSAEVSMKAVPKLSARASPYQ